MLGDTNLILRWAGPNSPERIAALAARRLLRARGEQLVFCPQVVMEFWCSATRPLGANGLGYDPLRVDYLLNQIGSAFSIVPDIPAIYPIWRRLVSDHHVCGRQVYDARLAAFMLAHGIKEILTFNTGDFRRYPGVTAIDPRDLAGIAY